MNQYYPDGVTTTYTNLTAAPKLGLLIAWLKTEQSRLLAELAKLPDEKPRTDTLGRGIATENTRKRDLLQHQLDVAKKDITAARVWLIECQTEQSWQIGLELAHWLNRPALAQYDNG